MNEDLYEKLGDYAVLDRETELRYDREDREMEARDKKEKDSIDNL